MTKERSDRIVEALGRGDYIALENGDIYSKFTKKVLIPNVDDTGYGRVSLYGKNYKVHQVVWIYFKGPVPDGFEIDHIDNNKLNNRLDNLQLLKPVDNIRKGNAYKLSMGKPRTKLDESTVLKIRDDRASGLTFRDLCSKYGIANNTAVKIVNRKVWSWLDTDAEPDPKCKPLMQNPAVERYNK